MDDADALMAEQNTQPWRLCSAMDDGADRDRYVVNTAVEGVDSIPVGNISLVSLQQEMACMSFLDDKQAVVDWSTTLNTFKVFALNSGIFTRNV